MRGLDIRSDLPAGSLSWLADRVQEMSSVLADDHLSRPCRADREDDDGQEVYASREFHQRGHGGLSLRVGRSDQPFLVGESMTARLHRQGTPVVVLEWSASEQGAKAARRTGSIQARSLLPMLIRIRDLLRHAARAPNPDQGRAESFHAVALIAASVAPIDANAYVIRSAGPWSPSGGICCDQGGRTMSLTSAARSAIADACGRMLRIEYQNGRYRMVAPTAILTDRTMSPMQAIRAIRRIGSPGPGWWAETSNA